MNTRRRRGSAAPAHPPLDVRVHWGDLARVGGEVLLVGHYAGVAPQRAELALDQWVSNATVDGHEPLLITEMTRSGGLRGELGELHLFPGPDSRLGAVAGMGPPGTFDAASLRRLAGCVAQLIGLLPRHQTVTTVVIGSGDGNLPVEQAAVEFVEALVEARDADPRLKITALGIVERQLERALQIQRALADAGGASVLAGPPLSRRGPRWLLDPLGPVEVGGGDVSSDFGCAMLLAALGVPDDGAPELLERALERLPPTLRKPVRERLQLAHAPGAAPTVALREAALRLRLASSEPTQPSPHVPTRLSFTHDGDDLRATAITVRSTVTERVLDRRVAIALHGGEKLRDAGADEVRELGSRLRRLLVHADLQALLDADGALVLELDEVTAGVPWEMLTLDRTGEPLCARRPVARQLRTVYSPRPFAPVGAGPLRALVIGDPASGALQLDAAREEAVAVAELLRKRGVQCTLLVGAPEPGTGAGPLEGVRAADYFEVVDLLLAGEHELVHFCGHAEHDAARPERCGWVFDGRLLTGSELQGMSRPPRLVFANACLSAQLLQRSGVAGLADEFFRLGVQDYIGAAWAVPSEPARDVATAFYGALLRGGAARRSVGEALRQARNELQRKTDRKRAPREGAPRAHWGAYQHYGDPYTRFVPG